MEPTITTSSYYIPPLSHTLFGARRHNIVETEGWSVESIVKTEADLAKVRCPEIRYDAKASGERTQRFREAVDDELPVKPPGVGSFNRGSMDTAVELRGWQQLMFDLHDRPHFVHDLMERITQSRIQYEQKRADVMGFDLKQTAGGLWEDDVNCDVLAPESYEEFVHPYERRVAELYDSVTYHSCGNLTPIASLVADLPNLKKIYFSEPWTDLKTVRDAAAGHKMIRIDMNPPTAIGVPEETLKTRMIAFAEEGRNCPLEIHMASARTGTVEQVVRWVRAGQAVFGERLSA